jgi:hypothetical protein
MTVAGATGDGNYLPLAGTASRQIRADHASRRHFRLSTDGPVT